ncbi:hypothetical protein [Streptomyces sp. NPDC088789]|uniref:scabin-related ADP-ribosyltransferase n=1 Tax=Streptomyces sp. NPDC088789 TaxID=3365899 RepID=UPI00381AF5B6
MTGRPGRTRPTGPGPRRPSPPRRRRHPPADCPVQFQDKIEAATDRRVDVDRITPPSVWRTTCGTLYRSDGRGPSVVFEEGFLPKDVVNGQYDVAQYVLVNQPSP